MMQVLEMNHDKSEIYEKIIASKYYILLNNVNHKIYIPNPKNIENNIMCYGHIIKVESGAYCPDSWIHTIQVFSNDIKIKV